MKRAWELLRRGLVKARIRFPLQSDEDEFYRQYAEVHRTSVQFLILAGAVVYYSFFLWDKAIDPSSADFTHLVRGVFVFPVLVACSLLLFIPSMHRQMEAICLFGMCYAAVFLSYIYYVLNEGFDYGAPGPLLIILYAVAFMPFRVVAMAILSFTTFASFTFFMLWSGQYSPGVPLMNALSVGCGAAFAIAAVGWREHYARKQFIALAELEKTRERVDDLLHSILPAEVVKRIQAGETTIADAHSEVSIVFADLVGFTEMSRKVTPNHLIEILNRIFTAFDEQAEKFGMEKIKTIGDGYMAVGGLNGRPEGRHWAERSADFARSLHEVVSRVSQNLPHPLKLRVGLHIGPIVAGVIGTKTPAFDCWGEAVNLASRLEHAAKPDQVLVSEAVNWRLNSAFRMEPLESLELKGIGRIGAYWLGPRL